MNRNYYTDSEDDIFNPGIDLIVSLLALLLIVLFIGAKFYIDQKLTNAKKQSFLRI